MAAEAAYSEHRRAEPAIDPTSESQPAVVATADAAAVPDQPRTVLVFKDGHQLEVQNYAIVGSMLYDLTPGHRAKIALADLDLTATAKQNDDRGIDFQLPVGSGNELRHASEACHRAVRSGCGGAALPRRSCEAPPSPFRFRLQALGSAGLVGDISRVRGFCSDLPTSTLTIPLSPRPSRLPSRK